MFQKILHFVALKSWSIFCRKYSYSQIAKMLKIRKWPGIKRLFFRILFFIVHNFKLLIIYADPNTKYWLKWSVSSRIWRCFQWSGWCTCPPTPRTISSVSTPTTSMSSAGWWTGAAKGKYLLYCYSDTTPETIPNPTTPKRLWIKITDFFCSRECHQI